MDILQFINQYWSILAFIAVVIGSWVKFNASVVDLGTDMLKQKEEHDKEIGELKTLNTALTTRFEEHKDKIADSINFIQQDIREIMTILKRDK